MPADRTRVEKQVRNLEVRLTPEERAERQTLLLRLLDQVDAEEATKKKWVSEHNARVADIKAGVVQARREIATGTTFRDVDCEASVGDGFVVVVRLDTGEVIERRNAHVSEAQVGMEEYL